MFASKAALLTRPVAATQFVTRDASTGNLVLNGSRFRFAGSNVQTFGLSESPSGYGAATDGDGLHLPNHAEINATMSALIAMNASVVRATQAVMNVGKTNSVQPTLGSFNAAALEPVDYALQQCAAAGIRIVFPLVDNYQYYTNGKFWYCTANSVTPDADATQFFTNSTIINSFKAHISFILDHVNVYTGVAYKDDPTILAWETGNELYVGGDGTWTSTYQAWTATIAAHIKTTKNARQLVVDGHGYGGAGGESGVLTTANVDILTGHAYTNGITWISDTAALAHANGRAFWVGEYTWTDAGFSPSPTWTLDQMLDVNERSTVIDGDTFWELWPQAENWGDGFAFHWPGDNANMQTRAAMLADHGKRMKFGATFPSPFVNDTFTGTDGSTLDTHTGEVGTPWGKQDGWTGVATFKNNRIWFGSTEGHYYSTGVAPSADYSVAGNVFVASLATSCLTTVTGRAKTQAATEYNAGIYYNGSSTVLYIKQFINGSGPNLGVVTIPNPAAGSTHHIELHMAGSSIWLVWDNGAVVLGPFTDTSIPAAGRAGVSGWNNSPTTGFHISDLVAA